MLSNKDIYTAYEELAKAHKTVYLHGERAIEAKAELELKKAEALVSGSVVGKNQQARDAALRGLLAPQHASLEIAEADSRAARLELDLARAQVSRVQALLRLAEVPAEKLLAWQILERQR